MRVLAARARHRDRAPTPRRGCGSWDGALSGAGAVFGAEARACWTGQTEVRPWVTDAAGAFNAVVFGARVAGVAVPTPQIADPGLANRDEASFLRRRRRTLCRVRAGRPTRALSVAEAAQALDAGGPRKVYAAIGGVADAIVGARIAVVAVVAPQVADPELAHRDEASFPRRRRRTLGRFRAGRATRALCVAVTTRALDAGGPREVDAASGGIADAILGARVAVVAGQGHLGTRAVDADVGPAEIP